MKAASYVGATYVPSESREVQGNRRKIQPYLDDGFHIKEDRNGYWVLIKSAKVLVTLENETGTKSFNMKSDICDLYGKQRISTKTYDKFCSDAEDGSIEFGLDCSGNEYSMKLA